jgi:hypothetical protein
VTRPDAVGGLVTDLSDEFRTVTLAVPTAGTAAPASASRRAWWRRPRPPGARLSPVGDRRVCTQLGGAGKTSVAVTVDGLSTFVR